jgi:hypothetical protein
MKVNYYVFPDNIPLETMKQLAIEYGLTVYYDHPDGWELNCSNERITKERLIELVITNPPAPIKAIEHTLRFLKVTTVKQLIRKYGGHGFTEFYNRRDGEFYGCTPIELKGRNQQVGYKVK